jgi:hypothetical protein
VFVAVRSHFPGVKLTDQVAEDLVRDYLTEYFAIISLLILAGIPVFNVGLSAHKAHPDRKRQMLGTSHLLHLWHLGLLPTQDRGPRAARSK